MKIYTTRHGQTSWNKDGLMQGQTDIPLDKTGIMQASRLAERFKDIPLCKVYTSDLSRAYETARQICKYHDAPLISNTALREASFGIYEGKCYLDPVISAELDNHFARNNCVPGGESRSAVFERMRLFLEEVIACGDSAVLLVGHHGSVRAAICYFMGISPDEKFTFSISNTAVHCFERDVETGLFSMICENDKSHLDSNSGNCA